MSEAIDEKFALILEDDKTGIRTLDLMRLSEIFSRADDAAMQSPQFASMFNDFAMRLSRQLSTDPHDTKVTKNARKIMRDMTLAARDHGVDCIIMPIHEKNAVSDYFRRSVLENGSFQSHYHVGVELIDSRYRLERRIYALGDRKPDTHTALHYQFDKPTGPTPG